MLTDIVSRSLADKRNGFRCVRPSFGCPVEVIHYFIRVSILLRVTGKFILE